MEGAACTGASTGPRTAKGLKRSRRARWKHGRYSAEARAARKEVRLLKQLLRRIELAGNLVDM